MDKETQIGNMSQARRKSKPAFDAMSKRSFNTSRKMIGKATAKTVNPRHLRGA